MKVEEIECRGHLKEIVFGSTVVYGDVACMVVSSPSEIPKGMVLLVELASGMGRYVSWETMVPIVPYKAVRCDY
jgi:hypothetical protein